MSEHTPLTEVERRKFMHAVHEWCDGFGDSDLIAVVDDLLAARTSTATADTGLRERVEAELDLAEQYQRHVADDEVLVAVGLIRNALNGLGATAAPTEDRANNEGTR